MRLERLEIAGFMHFTEPAVLDLRDIAEGSLVAITGTNGHGKTRLLDAGMAVIDGEFPSRAGNIADYATARDAYIDARYSVEGRGVYRARLNVDGQTRKSDAVLELVQANGSSTPLNDGKVSTFKEAAGAVFPPKELRLASAFSAQNRNGSFVTAKPAARKDLFGALIGTEHYARMAATAKACTEVVDAVRLRLTERRDLLARETTAAIADALQQRANALQAEGGQAELRRAELQTDIEALTVERTELTDQAIAHLKALERAEALKTTIATRAAELTQVDRYEVAATQSAGMERARADERKVSTLADLDRREAEERDKHEAIVKDCDERIAGNQWLTDLTSEITAAAAATREAEQQITVLRAEKDDASDQREQALEQVRFRQQQLDASATTKLTTAQQQVKTLSAVPCGGAGAYAECQFLTQARAAQAAMLELESAVARGKTVQEGITLWQERATAYGETVKAKAIAIAQVEARIKSLESLAKYAPELAATQARIEGYDQRKREAAADLQARLADLTEQRSRVVAAHEAAYADIAARLGACLSALADRRAALVLAKQQAETSLVVVQADAEATQVAAARLVSIDQDLDRLRADFTAVEASLAIYATKRDQLDQDRQAFAQKRAELDDVQARLRTAENRLLLWQLYIKAFGRDGLPTLEIAAAGPTVSNLTNDLLSSAFGTRFTLELVTQTARADGNGLKEEFTLRVFDNEYGGEARDIADLSGGERVVVEEAFRAALGLYSNSRNVAPIRTCWRDETTGALDPENAVRYVAMLRRMQALGGYSHVLFITHNEDCAALADTQIVVRNGQPEIRKAA